MLELTSIYLDIKNKVEQRLEVFENIGAHGTEEEIFTELVFCLMTPQTKSRQAEKAIGVLREKNLIFHGDAVDLSKELNMVRFRHHKANYICSAREVCSRKGKVALKAILAEIPNVIEKREWLVKKIKGIGLKEASHFLRNTGFWAEIAILDRHILRNLERYKIIEAGLYPTSEKKYLEIEGKMKRFAQEIKIPLAYLDFVLWYKETNDIFK
jgi:N-glycosylase/DNA lyase